MDILDLIQADLDALRALIFELRIADEGSEREGEVFNALVTLVKSQDDAQEKILLPLAIRKRRLQPVIHTIVDRIAGARDVEQMIECCTNRTTWRASVNVYCEMLETRLWTEQRELMPALYDELTAAEREKLGLDYKTLRGFKAGEPHRMNWKKIWEIVLGQTG